MENFGSDARFQFDSNGSGASAFIGDPQVFELLVLTILLCALIWVILEVIHLIGRFMIRRRIGAGAMEERIHRRIAAEQSFQKRIAGLTQKVEDLTAQNDEKRKQLEQQRRRLTDILKIETQYLRVLGEELNGQKCYYAYVYNRYVEQWNQVGKSHAMLHQSWSKPQPIQIWASTIAEARALLAERFPGSYGFVVVRLVPAEKRFSQADVA